MTGPVRAAAVDRGDRRGSWIPDLDARMASLETPVQTLLESALSDETDLETAEEITLVPDAHYPFHPSTGTVTDPAVVGALVAALEDRTDADIAVAGTTNEIIDLERTGQYLGYRDLLERFDAELVDLADDAEPRTDVVREVDGRSVSVSVPTRLVRGAVVTVPTLRPTEDGRVAGGVRRLADLVDSAADPEITAVAATQAVDPALSVMDATTAYGTDPYAADALFAGPAPDVDALGASLFGDATDDDPVLRLAAGTDDGPITVERVGAGADDLDFDALRDRLAGAELPPSDETHPAVTTAYRLYAAVGGDAVPPQLEQ
ncbi:DUF362 domain-containing protein [Halopiger xanaduensis]|uniref:DUF362 domain-containing protein n=1 Tax=Halopiger xanaduensis (strain DSM 18323 / JCM 14033 / SH-6) TaxID=797210 RepID=F8D5U5_HALXS|nr:DUF362 domain-containing protein [Halopiger xanaduensis]AEH37671.1 hypothetical protein Halxa_3056 [Halopiger xanaduensis SH-6]